MANIRQFFFRQNVSESELNGAFQDLEAADQTLTASLGFQGVVANAVVSQHAPNPNLTVDISGPGIIFDQNGQHIFFSPTQTVNLAVDDNGVSTAVKTAGNNKWLSIFVKFDRLLSDPRVDGNSQSVFFRHDESFRFSVVQGVEAPPAQVNPPALRSDAVLLADVRLTSGQTQILNASISTSRRQDAIVVVNGTRSIRRGRVNDALSDLLSLIATLSDGLSGTGGSALVGAPDSQGLAAGTVRSQLDALAQSLQSVARPGSANTFTATQEVDGPSDPIQPSLKTVATTARKHLWEVGGTPSLRLYVSNLLQWELTVNARWNGVAWVQDRNDLDSGKLELTAQGLTHRTLSAGSLASWDDSSWPGGVQLVSNTSSLNTMDATGTIVAPGTTETYAGYQGVVGASGTNVTVGCSFKKRYPASPSTITFTAVGTSSGVNGTFSSTGVTVSGLGVQATVNVATGAASFFVRVQTR
jgi:hypothetical protein